MTIARILSSPTNSRVTHPRQTGATARQIADLLGHARPSMTQDVYMGRGAVNRTTADKLQAERWGRENGE